VVILQPFQHISYFRSLQPPDRNMYWLFPRPSSLKLFENIAAFSKEIISLLAYSKRLDLHFSNLLKYLTIDWKNKGTVKSRLYVIHLHVLFNYTCFFIFFITVQFLTYSLKRFIHLNVFFLVSFGKRINETSLYLGVENFIPKFILSLYPKL